MPPDPATHRMPFPMRFPTLALILLIPAGAALAQGAGKPATPEHSHRPSLADAAAHGDGAAQYALGQAALHARGGHRDRSGALTWLTLAATNGNLPAAIEAARLYEESGAPAEAAQWWYKAGELGDLDARGHFLDLFLAGKTWGIGGSAGADWLAARAAGGDEHARLALGDAYAHGSGVAADLGRAATWYFTAAVDGSVAGMVRLGRLQLAEPAMWRAAAKETRDGKWNGPMAWPIHVDGRNRDGGWLDLGRSATAAANDVDLGALMLWRPGMVEGEQWLRRAARRGDADAEYALGMAYLGGLDLPLDLPQAAAWLQAAAWQKHPGALMTLAGLAATGSGYHGADPVRAWILL